MRTAPCRSSADDAGAPDRLDDGRPLRCQVPLELPRRSRAARADGSADALPGGHGYRAEPTPRSAAEPVHATLCRLARSGRRLAQRRPRDARALPGWARMGAWPDGRRAEGDPCAGPRDLQAPLRVAARARARCLGSRPARGSEWADRALPCLARDGRRACGGCNRQAEREVAPGAAVERAPVGLRRPPALLLVEEGDARVEAGVT